MTRRIARAGLSVILTGLAGCGVEHSIGVVLNPGETAHAKVLGDRTRVEVATGPAPVHVTLKTAGMAPESVNVQGTIARTLKGDTEIDLLNQGKEMAQVQLRTRNSTGLSLERGK